MGSKIINGAVNVWIQNSYRKAKNKHSYPVYYNSIHNGQSIIYTHQQKVLSLKDTVAYNATVVCRPTYIVLELEPVPWIIICPLSTSLRLINIPINHQTPVQDNVLWFSCQLAQGSEESATCFQPTCQFCGIIYVCAKLSFLLNCLFIAVSSSSLWALRKTGPKDNRK